MKKSVSVICLVSIVLLLSVSFVSAGVLGDINDWLKNLFGIRDFGEQSNLKGELGQSSGGGGAGGGSDSSSGN